MVSKSIFDGSASPSHVCLSCIAFIDFIKDIIEYKHCITSYAIRKNSEICPKQKLVFTDLPCVYPWDFA